MQKADPNNREAEEYAPAGDHPRPIEGGRARVTGSRKATLAHRGISVRLGGARPGHAVLESATWQSNGEFGAQP